MECVEIHIHGVLLLYLVISSALERYVLVAVTVRKRAAEAAIHFRLGLLASIVLTTIMVDHYPLFEFLCDSGFCLPIWNHCPKKFIMI